MAVAVTDWSELICRLERHMRHIDIAVAVGRTEGWVGLLKRGKIKEPPYSIGVRLRDLDVQTQNVVFPVADGSGS